MQSPEHDVLIREAHADNLIRRAGYRHLHRDPAAFELAIARQKRTGVSSACSFAC
jgi:hypothetical protein